MAFWSRKCVAGRRHGGRECCVWVCIRFLCVWDGEGEPVEQVGRLLGCYPPWTSPIGDKGHHMNQPSTSHLSLDLLTSTLSLSLSTTVQGTKNPRSFTSQTQQQEDQLWDSTVTTVYQRQDQYQPPFPIQKAFRPYTPDPTWCPPGCRC